MRARGHKWTQATVWNIERGERPLRLNEATALVEVLELQSVQSISAPEGEFEYLITLSLYQQAAMELAAAADKALRLQRQFAEELDQQAVNSQDESTWHQFGLMLRVTPAELVHDLQRESIPLLRAAAEASGPWSETLLEAVIETTMTSPSTNFLITPRE